MNKKYDYDIIVCGGGLSGVAAGISAARLGAEVLIIERYGFLGGAATNSLVNPFMDYIEDGNWINKGIFGEIIERLDKMGGLYYGNKATFNEEYLKIILDEMTGEAEIQVLFHSFIPKVTTESGRITCVTVANKEGLKEYRAKYFIDATGDADIAYFSGCRTEKGNEEGYSQPMTLNFRVCDVDRKKFAPLFPGENTRLLCPEHKKATRDAIALYREFRKQGKIRNPREDIQSFPCMVEHMIHFNSTRVVMEDATDPHSLSDSERTARVQMLELYRFLKENIPGFEESSIVSSAPQIGIRESRRLVGEYVLTAEDLLSCTKFEDSVARGIYNIDIHNPKGEGTILKAIPKGDYYTVPLRSLIPVEIKNLAVCGRPISATHEAHSAIRVMPIATSVGHGAGVLCALALSSGDDLCDVAYQKVQHELVAQGGLI